MGIRVFPQQYMAADRALLAGTQTYLGRHRVWENSGLAGSQRSFISGQAPASPPCIHHLQACVCACAVHPRKARRYSQAELEALDNQGRCLITDHHKFVLFNLYLPASTRPGQTNEAGDRYQHKLRMLQARPRQWPVGLKGLILERFTLNLRPAARPTSAGSHPRPASMGAASAAGRSLPLTASAPHDAEQGTPGCHDQLTCTGSHPTRLRRATSRASADTVPSVLLCASGRCWTTG